MSMCYVVRSLHAPVVSSRTHLNLNPVPLHGGNPSHTHTHTRKTQAAYSLHTQKRGPLKQSRFHRVSQQEVAPTLWDTRKHRTCACWTRRRRRRCLACPPALFLHPPSRAFSLNQRGFCHQSQELPFHAPMPKRAGGVSAKGSF